MKGLGFHGKFLSSFTVLALVVFYFKLYEHADVNFDIGIHVCQTDTVMQFHHYVIC